MCYGFDGETALRESLERRGLSRRSLFRGAAAGLAGAATLGVAGAPAASAEVGSAGRRPVPPGKISIQLYTVRAALGGSPGFDDTIRAIAADGYPRVEMAGYYGRTAEQIRSFFDSLGIRASSSHDGISGSADGLTQKLENAVTLGQRFINVPYLYSTSKSDWQLWTDQMNTEAAAAKGYGLAYGYHNHAHEFTIDLGGGLTPWEVLTSELDPSLVHLETDLYWLVTGGINSGRGKDDPEQFAIDTIKAAPQQVLQYHVKDKDPATGDMCDLGTGFIEFPRIFAAHRVDEYIVENDTPDVTPLQTARVGYDYLRHVRF